MQLGWHLEALLDAWDTKAGYVSKPTARRGHVNQWRDKEDRDTSLALILQISTCWVAGCMAKWSDSPVTLRFLLQLRSHNTKDQLNLNKVVSQSVFLGHFALPSLCSQSPCFAGRAELAVRGAQFELH